MCDRDDQLEPLVEELIQMNKWQKFEYHFPFYRMDVNGFVQHVKEAMKDFQKKQHT